MPSHGPVLFLDGLFSIVPAPTRSKLRSAVRTVNAVPAPLWLEKHPGKTFIGRIERGFDFPGYHFGPGILRLADAAIERFVANANRLYEQGRLEKIKTPLLGKHMRRWRGWAKGGVTDIEPACSSSHVSIDHCRPARNSCQVVASGLAVLPSSDTVHGCLYAFGAKMEN